MAEDGLSLSPEADESEDLCLPLTHKDPSVSGLTKVDEGQP